VLSARLRALFISRRSTSPVCRVAVVGAGVAGLLAALNLDCEVDVFEAARPGLRGRRCTGVVSRATLARLPRAERFALQRYSALEVAVPELELRLSLRSRTPFAYKLDRSAHELELAGMVEGRGHRLLQRAPVRAVKPRAGGVDLLLPAGWRRYDAVVLAEGYPPTLARALGLAPDVEARVGVQALARVGGGLDPEALYVAYSPRILKGFAWVVPLDRGRALVGGAAPRGLETLRWSAKLCSRLFKLRIEVVSEPFGGYVLRGYPRSLARGRVFALGDAVATVKSLSGGGLYAVSVLAKPTAEVVDAVAEGDRPGSESLAEIGRVLRVLRRGYLLAEALDRAIVSAPQLGLKLDAEVKELEYDDHAATILQVLSGFRGLERASPREQPLPGEKGIHLSGLKLPR
jgi:flavin-dependent dehydrogenase